MLDYQQVDQRIITKRRHLIKREQIITIRNRISSWKCSRKNVELKRKMLPVRSRSQNTFNQITLGLNATGIRPPNTGRAKSLPTTKGAHWRFDATLLLRILWRWLGSWNLREYKRKYILGNWSKWLQESILSQSSTFILEESTTKEWGEASTLLSNSISWQSVIKRSTKRRKLIWWRWLWTISTSIRLMSRSQFRRDKLSR